MRFGDVFTLFLTAFVVAGFAAVVYDWGKQGNTYSETVDDSIITIVQYRHSDRR